MNLIVLVGAVPVNDVRLILNKTDHKVSRFVPGMSEATAELLAKVRAKIAALIDAWS